MKTPVLDIMQKKMKKQGIKSFFKSVSTNSNVAKETNPVETATSVEIPSNLVRSTETEIVNEKPNQPDSTFVFPTAAFAKQNRSCQAQWFVEYKWLYYIAVNDNVTCFICKKHLQSLTRRKTKKMEKSLKKVSKIVNRQNVISMHQHSKLQSLSLVTF